MIVELIELRGIRALGSMRRFLDEKTLPLDLSKLYATLLSRYTSNDSENKELASTALNVLAISRRPLGLLEFAWAVALGVAPTEVTTIAALAEFVDHQRITSLTHPFIARIYFSNLNKRQVRLVHQLVKEFVIHESALNSPRRQYPVVPRETDLALVGQGIESLEACIMDICVRYLLLEEIGNIDLFSEEKTLIEALPQAFGIFDDDDELLDYDPRNCTWETFKEDMIRYDPIERDFGEFFVYASCYWMEHFGAATTEPLPDLGSIERLCHAGSTRLYNWINQNSRPDCTITERFPPDRSLYDPLSITSTPGSEAMLRHMLENLDFDKDEFLIQPAMEVAYQVLQWGKLSRLKILFAGPRISQQLRSIHFFGLVMRQWHTPMVMSDNWNLAFGLVDHVLDTLVEEKWGYELLRMAAEISCTPVIQRLAIAARNNEELRTELLSGVRPEQQDPLWEALQVPDLDMGGLLAALGPKT